MKPIEALIDLSQQHKISLTEEHRIECYKVIEKIITTIELIKKYNLITYQECFDAICTSGYVHDLPRNVVDLLKEVLEK